jgi:DNA-binding MarR family transcriptional regulator
MDYKYRREQSAGYLTNWAARLFVRAIERRLAGGNAGPMPVFLALIDGAVMTQKELATNAAVEQPTMANTLQRMERDGLVARLPHPDDRRSAQIALTPLGKQHAEIAMQAAAKVNGIGLGALTPAERPVYLDMVKRIIAALEKDEG